MLLLGGCFGNSHNNEDHSSRLISSDRLERRDREKMIKTLPKFMVLKSNYNNKYLRYINEDVQVHGFLQFSGDEVASPYAKYEVEMARTGNGLVHIRCCYNNKYWVRWSQNHWWIVAGAEEAEEDQSKWSCTLFEPLFIDATTIRFRHVQLRLYACLWGNGPPPTEFFFCAGLEAPGRDHCDIYTFIDWESLLVLPKHIAFKGDNGQYLKARSIKGYHYLQFASSDIGDPKVGNQVFTCGDGRILIKSDYFGKFWRRSPNWIRADSDDSTGDNLDTLFRPIKVADNVVALQNLGNNNFCKRLSSNRLRTICKKNCLNATVPTICQEARLVVEEPVISRRIFNVEFRLMDARIYSKNVLTVANEDLTNKTREAYTSDLRLSYTDNRTSTWNASISLKLGVTTSFQIGVPFIADGKIDVTAESSVLSQWGTAITSTYVVEKVMKVTVPPMTKVRVSLIATQGSCDVPFSYSQCDALTNGTEITQSMDDGIYTGVNCFNFQTETEEESL